MYNKKLLYLFCILVISVISVGYLTNTNIPHNNNLRLLDSKDLTLIFSINTAIILMLCILSITGLSLVFIIKILFTIGFTAKGSGINTFTYFSVSLIHGIFELIALFIVFVISVKHIILIAEYLKGKNKKEVIFKFYFSLLKKEIPITIILLTIGALLEVYVSNRILIFLI